MFKWIKDVIEYNTTRGSMTSARLTTRDEDFERSMTSARLLQEIRKAATILINCPHWFDLYDGNYKVEGTAFDSLVKAVDEWEKHWGYK